jgi:uncharacterized protein (DUF697 family)/uncharacterized tellurite resistance protein B-like protein
MPIGSTVNLAPRGAPDKEGGFTMALSEKEAVASFRVLVCMAKADGKLHEEERAALEAGLEGIPLPKGVTLKDLLAEDTAIETLVAQIESEQAREQTYQATYTMAYADGECTLDEQKLLDRLKAGLKIPEEKVSWTKRIVGEAKDTFLPSNIQPITNPEKRKKEIREDVIKYGILSAALGANPLPGVSIATDLAVVGIQVKMFRDIGQYYGHRVDKAAIKSLMAGLGLGTGARIAVTNLAKFIPGFGSALGATTSFVATYALGKIAEQWFDGNMKDDVASLKKQYESAKKDARAEYDKRKKEIEAAQKAKEQKLKVLSEELRVGELTQEQYQQKVAEMK